ncbi:hypothetical protein [Janthinobacterium sp. LB2P70]|uniref:hypothetical protein n=1 Tax=Janthinobacterium sp. LB2P70 TaxID=3424197 RepID=UPI003F24DE99
MKNSLSLRFVKYGKFTIEATAFKLKSAWHPQYRILDQQCDHGPSGHRDSDSYSNSEAAVDIAVQRAMFELDFGDSLPA